MSAWQDGYEAGTNSSSLPRLREENAELRRQRDEGVCKHFRVKDGSGRQIVTVGRRYAYTWDGAEPLAAGDRVLLPGNWLFKETSEGTVTGIGSDYQGELLRILRRLEAADAEG